MSAARMRFPRVAGFALGRGDRERQGTARQLDGFGHAHGEAADQKCRIRGCVVWNTKVFSGTASAPVTTTGNPGSDSPLTTLERRGRRRMRHHRAIGDGGLRIPVAAVRVEIWLRRDRPALRRVRPGPALVHLAKWAGPRGEAPAYANRQRQLLVGPSAGGLTTRLCRLRHGC